MKAALEDKNSSRYRIFISELRAVFLRDERLYNFVCESVPSRALENIKRQISAGQGKEHQWKGHQGRGHQGKRTSRKKPRKWY